MQVVILEDLHVRQLSVDALVPLVQRLSAYSCLGWYIAKPLPIHLATASSHQYTQMYVLVGFQLAFIL